MARRARNGIVTPAPAAGRSISRDSAGERRRLEYAAHGKVRAQPVTHPGHQAAGEQRVAAQLEEIVVQADGPASQQIAPQIRQNGGRPTEGNDVGSVGSVAIVHRWLLPKRSPVDLAIGGHRNGGNLDVPCRTQICRQGLCEMVGQFLALHGAIGHEVGSQAGCFGLHKVRKDNGGLDFLEGKQRRLDFSRLDAEAPDLHLLVDPAEIDQLAVGPAIGPVAGLEEPRSGKFRQLDEATGSKFRRLEISLSHPGPATQISPGRPAATVCSDSSPYTMP